MDADAAATCSSSVGSLDPPIEEVGATPSGQRVAGVRAIPDGIVGPPTAKNKKSKVRTGEKVDWEVSATVDVGC